MRGVANYVQEFYLVFNGSKTQAAYLFQASVALLSNAFKFLGHSLIISLPTIIVFTLFINFIVHLCWCVGVFNDYYLKTL